MGENAVDYDRIAQSVDYDRIAGAVDYDRIASVFAEQLSPAEDEDTSIEDEVAPPHTPKRKRPNSSPSPAT